MNVPVVNYWEHDTQNQSCLWNRKAYLHKRHARNILARCPENLPVNTCELINMVGLVW